MFVNLTDTPFCWQDRYACIRLKYVSDLLPENRILAKFSGDDHTRTTEHFRGILALGGIWVNKPIGKGIGFDIMVLNEVCELCRQEIDDNFMRLDAKALGQCQHNDSR